MKSSKEQLIELFENIREKGWVTSHRSNNTGIGKTFEDLAGIEENNSQGPDFEEFEIKAHRNAAASPITLFTLSPTFPKGGNRFLRDTFGESFPDNPNLKRLHTSIFADRKNSYAGKFAFKLLNDRTDKVLRIGVYDLKTKRLINSSVGYTYEKLKKRLLEKLNNLFLVNADRDFCEGVEKFHFTYAIIYTNPSFEKFLDLIDEGKIQYDIRIGSYQSGKKMGLPHDHGSGFRLRDDYMLSLYDTVDYLT